MIKRFSIYSFVISILWLGFVLAISFLEAPLKFQAPSLTLSVGLDVGRLIFWALNKIELLLMALLFLAFFTAGNRSKQVTPVISLFVILMLQTFWLLPALNERALSYINGFIPDESGIHIIYIILEVIKVIMLILLSVLQVREFKYQIKKNNFMQ